MREEWSWHRLVAERPEASPATMMPGLAGPGASPSSHLVPPACLPGQPDSRHPRVTQTHPSDAFPLVPLDAFRLSSTTLTAQAAGPHPSGRISQAMIQLAVGLPLPS